MDVSSNGQPMVFESNDTSIPHMKRVVDQVIDSFLFEVDEVIDSCP